MNKLIKSNCFKNRNTGHRSCISIFLSVILILGLLLQLSPSANALHVSAAVEDVATVKDAQQGDKVLFKGDNFIVKFEILAKWNTAYNANITIENTGKNTIHDWAIIFYSNDDITNLWNGKIAKKQNGLYLIDNATWNMDIRAGQSVGFGFTANYTDNIVMPPSYAMSSCRADVEADDYTVDYILYSNSGNQINSAIHIKNNTKEVIEDWELEFDFDAEITNIWKADITTHSKDNNGNHYVLRNPGYEQNVELNRNVEFGFNGTYSNETPKDYKLTKYSNEIDSSLDSDGDGLTNIQEVIIGCNPYQKDTDGDGLDDCLEDYLGLSPIKKDTDNNGIDDGHEDTDGDGLSNLDEIKFSCEAWNPDSDNDGLLDGEEVHNYKTSPIKQDTDGDGIEDYEEIMISLNPLKKDTDEDGVLDNDEKIYQNVCLTVPEDTGSAITKVEVSSQITGYMQSNTEIRNILNEDILCSEVVGLMGIPVDINSSGKFDEAEITFYYDESKLNNVSEDSLGMVWYDENNGEFQLLEDAIIDTDNNKISYVTKHFSKYLIVDRMKWRKTWQNVPDYRGATKYYDTLLSIDVSGSMSGEKLAKVKKGSKTLVNYMYYKDRLALMTFDNKAQIKSPFICDNSSLKKHINKLTKGGATDKNVGLMESVNVFTKNYKSNGNDKNIVILSDGALNYNSKAIKKAKNNNIKIYMVLIGGNEERKKKCKKIAKKTGGKYYYVGTDSDIDKVMKKVSKYIFGKKDTTDSDHDGLYDVLEKNGVMGINGQKYSSNPYSRDTDGDKLEDGYELTGKKPASKVSVKKVTVKYDYSSWISVYAVVPKSNPKKKDTDGDRDNDNVDPKPFVYELNGRFIQNLGKLENLAKQKSKKDVRWRVCQFLRSFNDDYDSDTWDGVGGKFDKKFKRDIKKNNTDLFNYFKNTPYIYADKNGNTVDVYHMAATMCGLYHKTSGSDSDGFVDFVQYQFMPEYHYDNLCGWAGDLQTLMNDADKSDKEKEKSYDEFKKRLDKKFLTSSSSFSSDDLYADTDGYNIYKLNKCKSLEEAFKAYYGTGYEARFLQFTNSWSENQIHDLTYKYTRLKYLNVIKWPLFKGHTYSKKESKAARDFFAEYVIDMRGKEDKKIWKKMARLRK